MRIYIPNVFSQNFTTALVVAARGAKVTKTATSTTIVKGATAATDFIALGIHG